MSRLVISLLIVAAISVPCSAAVIDIVGDPADRQLQGDGTMPWVGQSPHRVGYVNQGGVIGNSNSILVFQLPALPAGETVGEAHLSVALVSGCSWFAPVGAVDVYGLGWRATPAPVVDDFYVGPYGGDATDATPIQHALDVPTWTGGQSATVYGTYGTDVAGDQALADYLNAQYAAGAAGNYVFIRMNLDEDEQPLMAHYAFACANTPGSPVTMTLTTVPEPTTLALLALGAAVIRRRCR